MDPSIVSEEYVQLQQEMFEVQNRIKQSLSKNWTSRIREEDIDKEFPILSQLEETPLTVSRYEWALAEILAVLKTYSEDLVSDLDRCAERLEDDETALRWMKEALRYNTDYFQQEADKYQIAAWFPHYIAEQGLRPFLQLIAERSKGFVDKMNVGGACPCCAEPIRLKKEGMFLCPRCETEWQEKRHACAHCGEKEVYTVTVQEEQTSELELCDSCKNYVKIIKPSHLHSAAMIDLLTLHLDYIAQEEGYGDPS
ncbi:formate dehydrogenase accessory protein FdhE [Alteribacter aurantiacus]|uniref:formate dehydrogenase accessory protein FdhE n=1 Tax=Alteribacter aurantiacus TaxID=254410 RepID=UPI0004051FAF|nr:formate dehydrogenase accessory protein FdhE [Alteribacter aurantiacus]